MPGCRRGPAGRLRRPFDLCSIVNGKAAAAGNCKFCAQSAHYKTDTKFYGLLGMGKSSRLRGGIVRAACGGFPSSLPGNGLRTGEIEQLCAVYRKIGEECGLFPVRVSWPAFPQAVRHASAGGRFPLPQQSETSRGYFRRICTTHSYDDKLRLSARRRMPGLPCAAVGSSAWGKVWKTGSTWPSPSGELEIRSVPLNILTRWGTPLGGSPVLDGEEAERTAAVFRFFAPTGTNTARGRADQFQGSGQAHAALRRERGNHGGYAHDCRGSQPSKTLK